jgi:transposase-like protein
MSNAFAAPHFNDDEAARDLIASVRWPDGPICSHCGVINHAYAVTGRAGLYRCAEPKCRKDFTVTTGTVMERSKIPLHKWMMGFYLMNASKKGVSAHQLHRALGVTYQSAWFMCHRIREAMRDGGLGPLGGGGKTCRRYRRSGAAVRSPRKVRAPASARWWLLSSAAATSARSTLRLPTR